MLWRKDRDRKCKIEENRIDFSIDVKKKEHLLDYVDKEYFWVITRNSDGCSGVYACGWASSSEDAWNEANVAYKRVVKSKI